MLMNCEVGQHDDRDYAVNFDNGRSGIQGLAYHADTVQL